MLILTARGTVGDRILGLNTGADDYLPKPFDLDELEARMRALARRRDAARRDRRRRAGIRRPERRRATAAPSTSNGAPMELTPREAALLRALLARPGQARGQGAPVRAGVPRRGDVQAEAIEVVAYRLRKKLAATGVQLVTLRGLGYLLKAAA